MAENDERVDLEEEDNYMEEIDDEDVDRSEDEDDDPTQKEHGTGDGKGVEQLLPSRKIGREETSSDADQNPNPGEHGKVEEIENTGSMDEEDRKKHAELLSLPPYGSEVFIGGLSKEATEDDLVELCEPIGELHEVRVMKSKDTGESKGYAFVAFRKPEEGERAVEELKDKEFMGRTLRCSLSESKHRLFIGNIPKIWTEDQFRKVIHDVGPGVEFIDLKQDSLNPGRNRGFAFVEYYNNACAEYSRQKISNGSFKLDGNIPTVTWADPKTAPDNYAAASQVKALYVKNIPENSTPEQLKELFQRHGEVAKVVLPPSKNGQGKGTFGFIYFSERSSALKAVKDLERYEIDGQALEVTMAKPREDKKAEASSPFTAALNLFPPAYGFAGNPYGTLGMGGYGSIPIGYQQHMIYGQGPMPTGMQMVSMVLPDGQIGYVLQQPGAQMPSARPQRYDRAGGYGGRRGRGGSSRGRDDGYRNNRYRPY